MTIIRLFFLDNLVKNEENSHCSTDAKDLFHKDNNSKEKDKHSCDVCHKSFKTKSKLNSHTHKQTHDTQGIKCKNAINKSNSEKSTLCY